MKKMIIAFLTDSENCHTRSVADLAEIFGIDSEDSDSEDSDPGGVLAQKLETAFAQLAEVEWSEWIAEEDLDAFEEMVAAYESL